VDTDGRSWSYLVYGPFRTLSDFPAWYIERLEGFRARAVEGPG
jgi:hypothetical protein